MNDSTARYCSPSELASCVYPARKNYPKKRMGHCNCPDPCFDKVYEIVSSQATLSLDFYLHMANKYNESEAYWRANAAILEVYFPDLIEENVVHQQSFSLMTLFCNIGGVFGLILGAGLISILEIFDFCITKSVTSCKK